MKLLKLFIQDGEREYTEFLEVREGTEVQEIIDEYNSFEREVKTHELNEISEEEHKVLTKFGVL